MDQTDKQILGQIIDNQIILNKKIGDLIDIVSDLKNTIIKYDQEYQEEILKSQKEM